MLVVNRLLDGFSLDLSPWLVAASLAGALAIATLSGLYPAWKASRMTPMDAIRHSVRDGAEAETRVLRPDLGGDCLMIEAVDVHKTFRRRGRDRRGPARGDVPGAGRVVHVHRRPVGSGKSTLLYLLGALDRPTSGTIRVAARTSRR